MTTKIYRFPLYIFSQFYLFICSFSVFKKHFIFFPTLFVLQSSRTPNNQLTFHIFVGNYSTDAVVVEAALTLILGSFRFLAVHSSDQIGIMCESIQLFSSSFFLSLFFFRSFIYYCTKFYFIIVRSIFVLCRQNFLFWPKNSA